MRQDNPKKGASALRYAKYMAATTAKEYIDLGGSRADLKHDINKGFVKVLAPAAAAPAVVVMPPPAPAAAVPPTPAGSDGAAAAPAPAPPVAAPAPAAAAAPADPRLRVGRAVRKKFAGSGWFDGSVTSVADGSFEVRWSDGDEISYPFKAATKMLDAAEGSAVAPVAAAVAAPVVE